MSIYVLMPFIGTLLMLLGEFLPNETKKVYKDAGHDWNKVLIYSSLASLIGGVVSLYGVSKLPLDLNPQFIPFGVSIISYLTAQSFLTDMKVFLINRNILRVAYVSMYLPGLYNVLYSDTFSHNMFAFFLFTLTLVFIFVFIDIGASDVRMMAAAIPYVISIGGYSAIIVFIVILLLISIVMITERTIILIPRIRKLKADNLDMFHELGPVKFYTNALTITTDSFNKNKEGKKAIGPYMTLSFLIYLLAYPVFI